jgi:CelD/BcsL family acetyltransferase involved in cellulose biosynthesis
MSAPFAVATGPKLGHREVDRKTDSRDITVTRVTGSPELRALAAGWDELIDETMPGAVFRSSAWLLPWWDELGTGKELSCYVARAGARLVGVLPAYRANSPLGLKSLRLLGDTEVGSDYLGLVVAPGWEPAVTDAVARALVTHEADLRLESLDSEDPLLRALEQAACSVGARFRHDDQVPCPCLDIPKAGAFGEWLKRLPSGAGTQLERRRRWLMKQPDSRVEIITDEQGIVDGLQVLWRLHRARWANDGGGALRNLAVKRFHDSSARELGRRGWGRLYVLIVEGEPRAALYGFGRGRRFAYYQSGSDPDWQKRWVGRVVLGAAIQDAFERGLDEFDFLRGDEPYKSLFASSQRTLRRVSVTFGPRATSLAMLRDADARGRRLARETLPSAVVDWLRQRRRQIVSRGRGT